MRRMLFEKTGTAAWMSHLDTMRLMQRAFRRADVLLHHSQGYTPHAYVSMILPLGVGIESGCEIMEYEIDGDLTITAEQMNAVLPEGVRVISVYESDKKAKNLTKLQMELTLEYDGGVKDGLTDALNELFSRQEIFVEKRTKRGMEESDIRPLIDQIDFIPCEKGLTMHCVIAAQNPALNPMLLISAIERYTPDCKPDFVRYRRIEVFDEQMEVFR